MLQQMTEVGHVSVSVVALLRLSGWHLVCPTAGQLNFHQELIDRLICVNVWHLILPKHERDEQPLVSIVSLDTVQHAQPILLVPCLDEL